MESLLFLPHRLPYPPNKGDKVRSYQLLRFLAARYRVFLATFIDDPADEAHVRTVGHHCAGMEVVRLNPKRARLASLRGLVRREALTLPYFRDAALASWVERILREEDIRTAVVFSSAMAQYVPRDAGLRLLTDFVDVDSAKWRQYGEKRRWPLSWLYRREAEHLLAFERDVALRSAAAFFVTEAEAALFQDLAPSCSPVIEVLGNGVDADFFSPDPAGPSPFGPDEVPLVFTGAMDYWPNVDAMVWFVQEVLPFLVRKWPGLRLYIVGMRPSAQVRELAGESVVVTGTVPDVRGYLSHARVVVAPLRVARGVQNKVLEAMAMGRPVVVAAECARGIDALPGVHLEVAEDAGDFASGIDALLRNPERAESLGRAAREQVIARYGWAARLQPLESHLQPDAQAPA